MAPEGEKDICPIFQNIDPIIAPKKKNNQRLEKNNDIQKQKILWGGSDYDIDIRRQI